MTMNGLRERVLEELLGKVWHTTNSDRYNAILQFGAIVPEPDIADCDRWGTACGREYYPFVRSIGGVSLFDFRDFDPIEYRGRCPLSNWEEFIPFRKDWSASVWIEIDTVRLGNQFIGAMALLERWKEAGAYKHRIMPYLEAAILRDVPTDYFIRAFTVSGRLCWT